MYICIIYYMLFKNKSVGLVGKRSFSSHIPSKTKERNTSKHHPETWCFRHLEENWVFQIWNGLLSGSFTSLLLLQDIVLDV